MTRNNNNIPPYAEEIIIENENEKNTQTDLKATDILKTKNPIPSEFVELTKAKKNNWGSTEDLEKELCERYLFSYKNKRIWLDIPHTLMEKLELPKGKSCPWPFYLDPKVLEKQEIEGAITIENEEEIFLVKPGNFIVKDQEAQTELSSKKISELEKELEINKQSLKEVIENLQNTEKNNQDELGKIKKELDNEKKRKKSTRPNYCWFKQSN